MVFKINTQQSTEAFEIAKQLMPGGVNSPVRAFKSVGIDPIFISHGIGSEIYDIDGNRYIDYILSWGPLIHGHADKDVASALLEAIKKGTSFGLPTLQENKLAQLITTRIPSIEKIRMVNSGTEATMSAIRLARGFTGKNIIVKFEGNYHGHSDHLLVKAGSGIATLGLPDCPGVPLEITKNTLSVPYNDIEALYSVFDTFGSEIAAVIVEPFAGNMAGIPADPEFLQAIRLFTTKYGALFILDEVMTGFRIDYHSAQGLYNIQPDLTCLGKIIGGGMPVGAYGGKKEIMNLIAPEGNIYQAGTLSGNPIAMIAGYTTINKLTSDSYNYIEELSDRLIQGLKTVARKSNIALMTTKAGTMIGLSFTDNPLQNFDDARKIDSEMFRRFYVEMLKQGILLPPSQYESIFLSTAHSIHDIDETIHAADVAFQRMSSFL
ncbi:glutamate-1-semialdehyde-2,1-aminomutase [Lysinibacillus sphaericus]|uniref:Glutamate-1-semialdehyde 2,1-aminomutase n=1 Tax=Lysinibacillus sphaericus TaxID=1421 RepID=A0A2S0K0V0_LYSSH|nr:glutamate-1-semialdehyde-2,1-aminomutase [Lysinibacillus sphaericus]TKI20474.1 glutamate-1-semialdehyde-2,1-aminomutase [Lysinibacillus sphaericus]GEC81839.1 glutamate-1-semialdehyde 2,1-aminomutase 1 [Lysinibacillus sphaericus]SUV17195.1 glutamate-1-semialdehyde aminotransferase [Lysinibacillus sphaericus]